MAETDRELMDRLEKAQGDLQRAEKRLAELEAQSTEALTADG